MMMEYQHQSENPFHAIFLIDSNMGVELVSKRYSQKTPNILDADKISGILRALEMFINHLAYSNQFDEQLQEINFQGISVVFERYGKAHQTVLCVGISKRVSNLQLEHVILKQIVRDFYREFSPQLLAFQGDVRPFRRFTNYLSEFPHNWQTQISEVPQSTPSFSQKIPSFQSRHNAVETFYL